MTNLEALNAEKWVKTKKIGKRIKVTLDKFAIYDSLKLFGVNYLQMNGKDIFYFRNDSELYQLSLLDIKDLVWNKLEKIDSDKAHDALNAYLDNNPVKRTPLLKYKLSGQLTEEEYSKLINGHRIWIRTKS